LKVNPYLEELGKVVLPCIHLSGNTTNSNKWYELTVIVTLLNLQEKKQIYVHRTFT
jgi:hypothetical protein